LLQPLKTQTFWLPKAGNSDAEYEDAYAVGKWKGRLSPPPRLGIAIADGATEAMLSRQWANLLVRRFVRHLPNADNVFGWLDDTLRAWQHDKRQYLAQRERSKKPVQWYEEPGLEAGAFAALLGLVFSPAHAGIGDSRSNVISNEAPRSEKSHSPFVISNEAPRSEKSHSPQDRASNSLQWNALSVGDCLLVQIRDTSVVCMFPYNQSSALHNRPYLLSSNRARNLDLVERFLFAAGDAHPGDRFYMMTDALAGWFLRSNEAGAAPWLELDTFCEKDAHAFADWLDALRTAREIRNDDVTLIHLEV
jgi:hypothetical protein